MENEIKMSLKKKILNSEEGKFLCLDTCLNMVEASMRKPRMISILAYNEQEKEIKYAKKTFNPIGMKKFLVGLDEKIIGLDFCFGDIVSMQVDIGTINEVEKGKELYAKYAPSNSILFFQNKIELAVSSDLWNMEILENIVFGGEFGRFRFKFRDIKLYLGKKKINESTFTKVQDLLNFMKEADKFNKVNFTGVNKKKVVVKKATKMKYDMIGTSEAVELLFAGADELKYKPIDQKMVKSYRKEALEAGLYEVKYKGQRLTIEIV